MHVNNFFVNYPTVEQLFHIPLCFILLISTRPYAVFFGRSSAYADRMFSVIFISLFYLHIVLP
jgi:hypothetical protein